MRTLRAVCLLGLFLCGSALAADTRPTRILFIGNSLTSTGDIPGQVEKLAHATGRAVMVETVAQPNFSLADHRQDGRALSGIAKGWDVVVLQQGTSAQPSSRAELIAEAKRFSVEIRKAGARPALYMVWPMRDRPFDFPATIASWRQAAAATDGLLLPVGEAWLRVLSKDRETRLYSDGLHPSALGSALAAMTIFLAIFPAGPEEFTEDYARRLGKALDLPRETADRFLDAATRSIDEPMAIK
jgi:hypothetical protein